MEFRKKLKTRLYLAISYIVLGSGMIAAGLITKTDNQFVSSFGLALAVMGIVRLKQYFVITKNEERIRKQEIAETDERNISIVHRARSITFSIYVLLACLTVMVLSFMQLHQPAMWISFSVFVLIAIYWICYFVVRRKY